MECREEHLRLETHKTEDRLLALQIPRFRFLAVLVTMKKKK
jgi:hypothetical protein